MTEKQQRLDWYTVTSVQCPAVDQWATGANVDHHGGTAEHHIGAERRRRRFRLNHKHYAQIAASPPFSQYQLL